MSAATRLRIAAAVIAVALLASAASAAQFSGTLSGPVLGYVFDRNAGKLRPVRGILGSSTVGAPIESGFAISRVLSLDARHAVVSPEGGPELVALTLEGAESSAVAISGVSQIRLAARRRHAGTVAAFSPKIRRLRMSPAFHGATLQSRPCTWETCDSDGET
jgi:hypothetical protein